MRFQGNLLYVRDLEASVRFYEGGLGLPVVARPAPHMAIVGLGNGRVFLHADPEGAPAWLTEALDRKVRLTDAFRVADRVCCHTSRWTAWRR